MGGAAWTGSALSGAVLSGGQAILPKPGAHLRLPRGVVDSYVSVSVEAWISTANNTGSARVFEWVSALESELMVFSVYRDAGGVFGVEYKMVTAVNSSDPSDGYFDADDDTTADAVADADGRHGGSGRRLLSAPTSQPSQQPSQQPSSQPSSRPSSLPSIQPPRSPTTQPTNQP